MISTLGDDPKIAASSQISLYLHVASLLLEEKSLPLVFSISNKALRFMQLLLYMVNAFISTQIEL